MSILLDNDVQLNAGPRPVFHLIVEEIDVSDGLSYDPETGIVTRAGCAVGTPDKDGYLRVRFYGELAGNHQVAWLLGRGVWVPPEIDHQDRDRSNNRLTNLVASDRVSNNLNVGVRVDNTSGHKGVGWHAGRGKWRARARKDGKRVELGYFDTAEEAAAAYLAFDPSRAA